MSPTPAGTHRGLVAPIAAAVDYALKLAARGNAAGAADALEAAGEAAHSTAVALTALAALERLASERADRADAVGGKPEASS